MSTRPRGAMFLEVCISLVVVATAMVAVAQLLVVVAAQRQTVDQRRLAVCEAANLLEQVMVTPWNELDQDQMADMALSPEASQRLRDARFEILVVSEEGPPLAKQVTVRVDWVNRAGQREQPVELVAWKHQVAEESSP